MSIERSQIIVSGVQVQIVRKAIKNLHLGVYPPHGRVRVAAPLSLNDHAVRRAVVSRLAWIKRQQSRFHSQSRQSPREMLSGESHYFLGRRYRLRVMPFSGEPFITIRNKSHLDLHAPSAADRGTRDRVLRDWYRSELKTLVPPLIQKWQSILCVKASDWGVKKMKTKWGSCQIAARRIWLNLELIKKPSQCLEYIIAHELVHLLERHHNDRFTALMDEHLPHWRSLRKQLNSEPLCHEDWSY